MAQRYQISLEDEISTVAEEVLYLQDMYYKTFADCADFGRRLRKAKDKKDELEKRASFLEETRPNNTMENRGRL